MEGGTKIGEYSFLLANGARPLRPKPGHVLVVTEVAMPHPEKVAPLLRDRGVWKGAS